MFIFSPKLSSIKAALKRLQKFLKLSYLKEFIVIKALVKVLMGPFSWKQQKKQKTKKQEAELS